MWSPELIVVVAFFALLLLMASGMWISVSLGIVGIGLLFFGGGFQSLRILGILQFNITNSFLMTAMPLFIFMGAIILRSGLAERIFEKATSFVGFLPGGLLHTNIVSCAIFSAISGSSVATAATIGTVAIPEQEGRGYNRRLVYGSLAAGGTLGILIPPSLLMIAYSAFVGESLSELFIAAVFPGIILVILFMTCIGALSIWHPDTVPERTKFSLKEMASGALDIWPILLLIFMVLGTIYFGVATPTEAAGIAAFISLVICVLYRKLTWNVLMESAIETAKIVAWVMLIIIGASVFSMGLSYLKVPAQLAESVASLPMNRIGIFTSIVLFYLVMGMFVEGLSMTLLTLPIIYPIMMALGFDGVWFGIVLTVIIEMAQITPPMGVNLFVIDGITGKKHLGDIIIGILPFFACQVVLVIMLTAFPDLALWLPRQMVSF